MTKNVITYTNDALELWNNSNGMGKLMIKIERRGCRGILFDVRFDSLILLSVRAENGATK